MLIGYQEFPTAITSHSTDINGNQYFTGSFKGELKANNQVLASGKGLEDIFWVKTDSNGKVLRHKTYGSANIERAYENASAMGNNVMLFGFTTLDNLALDTINIQPYTAPNGSKFASVLVASDTAGKVRWSHKTNLQNYKIFFANSVFHLFAPIQNSFPPVKFNDATIIDSIGRGGFVHLMLNENGDLLGAKTMSARQSLQSVSFINFGTFSDKHLFLQIRASGDTSFFINKTLVSLPSGPANYEILIKIDSSYSNFRLKVLNPQRQNIAGWLGQMNAAVAENDSIYHVYSWENSSVPSYTIDGFSQVPQQNRLYVFDSTLTLRRQIILGSSKSMHPLNTSRRKIHFRYTLVKNGKIYLNGVYAGSNESPLNTIPVKDTAIGILPGLSVIVNQNGPSLSFIAQMSLSGQSGKLQWYGDHKEYEHFNVSPLFFHSSANDRIVFAQNTDNVWNPWFVNSNLSILSGSMSRNADMPEVPQMINFFPDGSRIILGYARGKTALDSNGNFITNINRRDAFLMRLRANNEVVWYKRFHSTLTSSEVRKLIVTHNKAYFLINYLGSQNDSNYIKVENNAYPVGTNASLLANIDTSGNLSVLNLNTALLRSIMLMNFALFSNGDVAVVTMSNPLAYRSFPLTFSPQIFRMNSSNGNILDGRKIMGTSLLSYAIEIDDKDQMYLAGNVSTTTTQKFSLHDGTKTVDSLTLSTDNSLRPSLLKMEWSRFHWLKRFSGNPLIKQNGDLALVNNIPVFGIASLTNSAPLFWDGQTVHNGFNQPNFSIVSFNANGSLLKKKLLTNYYFTYMKAGLNGKFYVSGSSRATQQVDTIQIGYSGEIDALALVLDTNLIAKQSFRASSLYSETMTDIDIYRDSVAALAYTAQTAAQVYLNRSSVASSDYDEDGYVGLVAAKQNVVTGINNPLPASTSISITPNPVINQTVTMSIAATQHLRTIVTVYDGNGRILTSTVMNLIPGTKNYILHLPSNTPKGFYQIVFNNKSWKTSRSFISL